jgi:ribonuclease HI
MVEGRKQWDCVKITNLFSPDVAKEVLAVPLIGEVLEDTIVWKEEQHGEYTVRSGYRAVMRAKEDERRRAVAGNWKNLWQILAPPKAKHLLWRICRNCLPTRVQLRHHYVQCPEVCELCSEENEDSWHVLFGCNMVRNCWNAAGLQAVVEQRLNAFDCVQDIIFDICSKESKEVAGRVATLLWLLWHNRNQWIWNQEKKDGAQLGAQAFHMWDDWYKVQQVDNNIPDIEQVQQLHNWIPPRHGWFKCNVDAAFHNGGRITSGGWCIRDERGQFICAGTNLMDGELTIIEAEALALIEAMRMACNMNMHKVMFETDAQIVVGAANSNHVGVSLFSTIICNIKNLLLLNPNFEVKFVKRQANSVAHKLARAANSWASRCVFYSVPPCIEHQLLIELS